MLRVLGLGDEVVDKYVNLGIMYPGGNALNFAVFAKKLRQNAAFMGVFGSDEEARHVEQVIDELKIDHTHSRHFPGENGCARVEVLKGDRIFLGSNEGGVTKEYPIQLTKEDKEYIAAFDLVHMGLYSHVEHLLPDLLKIGTKLSFDFSDDFTEEDIKKNIDFVNFGFFSCSDFSDEEVKKFLENHFQPHNSLLCVTRGEHTVVAYNGLEFFEAEPDFVTAVDTMAAGDSFLTAFLIDYLLTQGKEIVGSLKKANKFAAQSCLIEGSFGYGKSYK